MNTKKIIEGLERCGFRLIENYEDSHLLFRRDIEKIPFIFVVVMPHEGNGNRIMLRLTRRKIMTDGLIVTFSGFIKMNTT